MKNIRENSEKFVGFTTCNLGRIGYTVYLYEERKEGTKLKYTVLLDLALILFSAKMLGMLARRIGIPQVVGEIISGLIIGPNLLGIVQPNDVITYIAEIGVIMLMFVAGLETDLKEIKKSGVTALLVACMGVLLPLIGGFCLYGCLYGFAPIGSEHFTTALFIGTIITATSVGITVEVLREIGKLSTPVGTVILSAAIIDDVIGIVLLSVVSGFSGSGANPLSVLVRTVLFFAFSIVVGLLINRLFKWLDKISPHRRRIPIFSLAFCFLMSYIAEEWFGIADITGAFIAGVIFCNIKDAEYIARRVDINSYMIFSPVFFAGIGIRNRLSMDKELILFSILFVAVAMLMKILGCGIVARLRHFNARDSLRVGVGMMARGEVALIVAQKGVSAGVLDPKFFTAVILLIMVSSIVTPILLRLLYRPKKEKPTAETPAAAE